MHKDIDDLDADLLLKQSSHVVEAERQVRLTLSASAQRPIELKWHPGPRGRLSVIILEPGKSVVQPLSKAQCWFGPFSIPEEFANTSDERKREQLRKFYADEKKRFLDRYDYPRGERGLRPDMAPVGPHRAPDVTVTIIEADGQEHDPISLHRMYKIGEWDERKDTFIQRETPEQIEARYKAELDEKEAETRQLRREVAELAGLVKGVALSAAGKA